jgi:hypothetical protein
MIGASPTGTSRLAAHSTLALAFVLGFATSCLAQTADPRTRTVVAAVGDDVVRAPYRSPVRETADDAWRSAQTVTHTAADGQSTLGTVLVSIAAHASEDTDADIAKQHNLEIVKRTTIQSLSIRIISYRLRDSQDMAAVLQHLRADPRVANAQSNVAYYMKTPEQAAGIAEKSRRSRKASDQPASSAPRAAPGPTRSAERLIQEPGAHVTPRASRISAAEVLTGGL